ncbi:MAG: response regulator [Candidatus Promineifilaceae bacterium]
MAYAVVLVADNDQHQLQHLQEFLESRQCKVLIAATPEEAKRHLQTYLQISVAIIDIRLRDDGDEKDTSGLMVARLRPDVPKIILTAYPGYETTRQALNRHLPLAHDYLSKTEGFLVLLGAIQQIVEKDSFHNISQESINRVVLFTMIQFAFNESEFATLLFYLKEELRHRGLDSLFIQTVERCQTLSDRIQMTIKLLDSRDLLIFLMLLCRQLRPKSPWQNAIYP